MKYITQQQMYEPNNAYIPMVEHGLTDRLYMPSGLEHSPFREDIVDLIKYNAMPNGLTGESSDERRRSEERERKRQDDYHKGIKREKKNTDIIERGIGELLKRIIPHG